ncbi:cell wall hydrolase [Sphingosinicella rhizophila]|uniref:Cell wall hydrolase n=1 Tax=Sphingosinicella rhizophila TaxID=3050082 RepID=A0ABU3Q813_9SPHN|nr:cell wall hydrolase [Sphingosinicella sp. GR2756]MDT9599543.1 cell wall hydrolase [Sphingosinicella sp. GR2756]
MRSRIHVAGYAAAAIAIVGGFIYAGPSRAWEADVPTSTSSYIDHSAAILDPGESALNPAKTEGEVANPVPPAAVAVHANASIEPPEPVAARSLADLVSDFADDETATSEEECLAGAVYFESKGESLKGQLSVAEVILNRARSSRFPSSICGVVKQRGQFSFIRGGRFPAIRRSSAAWHKAVAIAQIALRDLADGPAPQALFFHATHVSPRWRGLTRVATVGNHIFYR